MPGHRLCAGCAIPILVRNLLRAIPGPKVVVTATGCLEVASTIYPYTAWKVPWIHIAFENAAAVASGLEAAFKALKRKYGREGMTVIAIAGDGGTYDIGLQALSGALERGHNFIFVCYDNEAYMNTGIQRSGGTPMGAATTTSPAGRVIPGKPQRKKPLMDIVVAHGIPYAATLNPAYIVDMYNKLLKAASIEGPKFLHYFSPCPTGWGMPENKTIEIARLAVQTLVWPLYEVENGKYRITVMVRSPKPIEEYLKVQGRFSHLFKPENRWIIEELQKQIQSNWERLLKLSQM
ncbi:pyruvate ferredoxin oxidoreductase [Candidatus Geothermarchaeota archaeon ex4572_27]|nr:MAG: pyruvate ferredoxin oxidoreductase [Candidatus Geothermarchaeota archaeon ex4572_27]